MENSDWTCKLALVSIVIPCYNSEKYIKKCIESVLTQDYKDIEIIVVDDGSTDSSIEILKTYKGVDIYSQVNSGACAARNYGLRKCRGYYVKFLDSDDFLNPESISLQVEFANNLQEMQIAYGYKTILSNGKTFVDKQILDSKSQFEQLINKNIMTTLPLHKRKTLVDIGGFDEGLRFRQEWDLHLKLSMSGYTFVYHGTSIYTQVMHNNLNRISARKLDMDRELNNLGYIRSKFSNNNTEECNIAWAHKYWTLGRQFLKLRRRKDAEYIFLIAKKISPGKHLTLQPKSYKIAVSIFGPNISERLISLHRLLSK